MSKALKQKFYEEQKLNINEQGKCLNFTFVVIRCILFIISKAYIFNKYV